MTTKDIENKYKLEQAENDLRDASKLSMRALYMTGCKVGHNFPRLLDKYLILLDYHQLLSAGQNWKGLSPSILNIHVLRLKDRDLYEAGCSWKGLTKETYLLIYEKLRGSQYTYYACRDWKKLPKEFINVEFRNLLFMKIYAGIEWNKLNKSTLVNELQYLEPDLLFHALNEWPHMNKKTKLKYMMKLTPNQQLLILKDIDE